MSSGYKNFLGDSIELEWVMNRINNPLSISAYAPGAIHSKSLFDLPANISTTYYDNADLYFEAQEIKTIESFIRYKIANNKNYPNKIYKKGIKIGKQIQNQKIEIGAQEKMLDELLSIFKEKRKPWEQMIAFMSYRGSVQMADVLKSKVEDILMVKLTEKNRVDDFQKIMDIFSMPTQPSIIWEEKKDLLKLSCKFKNLNEEKRKEKINVHLKKWNWINYHWFAGEDTTQEKILERLREKLDNPTTELKRHLDTQLELERDIKTEFKKLNFNKDERVIVVQLRNWIHMRSYAKDNICLATYKLLPILHAIANHLSIDKKDIIYLTEIEIDSLPKDKSVIEKIEVRKREFIAGIFENKFQIEKININRDSKDYTNTIQGNIAMKGRIQGSAKTILSPKENNKVEKGDILVTSMTTPDFLPAMERAAGFITDEGGITCHASIVAREMKKPCIIGTKNATKILKNGDTIELNADEGIVNIIKKLN